MNDPVAKAPSYKRYLPRLIGLAILVAVLCNVDLAGVWRSLQQFSLWGLAGSLFFCTLVVLIKSLRWHLLLQAVGLPFSFAANLHNTADGLFWGVLTPGRLGELKRAFPLKQRYQTSLTEGVILGIVDRIFDLFTLLIVVSVFSIMVAFPPGLAYLRYLVLAFIALCVAGLVFRKPIARLLDRWLGRSGLGILATLRKALLTTAAISNLRVLQLCLISLASFACYVLMVWSLARFLPINLGFDQMFLAVAIAMSAGMLPISYFNLGTRELAMIGLFAAFGLTSEDALGFSAVLFLGYPILAVDSGLLALAVRPLTRDLPRHQAE